MVQNKKIPDFQNDKVNILTQKEYEDLYKLPKFNEKDRINYFELNFFEKQDFDSFNSNDLKILYLLQLGYFKSTFQFYMFELKDVVTDVKFILERYFEDIEIQNLKIDSNTRTGIRQRNLIKNLLNFEKYNREKHNFDEFLLKICENDLDPKFIFQNLHKEFIERRIILPGYKTLQLLIGSAIKRYEDQLKSKLESLITPEDSKNIQEILNLSSKKTKISVLAFLRTPAKGFRKSEIQEEIEKREDLNKLFPRAKQILKEMDLSETIIEKYAKFVDSYEYSHIKGVSKDHLYVICFVYIRYLKSNDDMMRTFTYWMNKYHNDVEKKIDQRILQDNIENSKLFPNIAKLIQFFYIKKEWKNMNSDTLWDKLMSFLDEEQAENVSKFLQKRRKDHANFKWATYKDLHKSIQIPGRQFLRSIKFSYSQFLINNEPKFIKFIDYYIEKITSTEASKTIDWSLYPFNKNDKDKKLLEDDKDLKEIHFFNRINKYIKFGEIFLEDSIEFRHLELDLIPKIEYYANKKFYNSKISSPYGDEPLKNIVDQKMKLLEENYHSANLDINNGDNPFFKIKSKKDWTLQNENKGDEDFTNFFKEYEIDLFELLLFVESEVGFLKKFTHISPINTKREEESIRLLSVLIGLGTNKGLYQISKDLEGLYTGKQLTETSLTRFRPETIQKANEMIINKTSKLPIFKHFSTDDLGTIHSSSDGQKFSVSVNTIRARYSQKYFGKGKGISVLTLTANFQPLAVKTISPNEYEGNYLLELLLMNESEIQPERHSTDNHGINEVNFGMLDFFGFKFCPRYKNLSKRTQNLCGNFKLPENYILRPGRKKENKIDVNAILSQEDEIMRVIASISTKKTAASTIIKKIKNLHPKHALKKAFVEYNKIIASTFMLEYIQNEKFRTQIQIHLNRGEAFHRLKKEVFYAEGGKIKGKSEHEQDVHQGCAMLICSAIIYYNCRILSILLKDKNLSKEDKEKVMRTTPFVWNHVGLYGKYDFKIKKKKFKEIVEKLK